MADWAGREEWQSMIEKELCATIMNFGAGKDSKRLRGGGQVFRLF